MKLLKRMIVLSANSGRSLGEKRGLEKRERVGYLRDTATQRGERKEGE